MIIAWEKVAVEIKILENFKQMFCNNKLNK